MTIRNSNGVYKWIAGGLLAVILAYGHVVGSGAARTARQDAQMDRVLERLNTIIGMLGN